MPATPGAFSLVPVYENHHFHDTCPASHLRLDSPFTEVDHVARQVERLRRELGLIGGIVPLKDLFEVDLDVQGYKPENINIQVQDNLLTISGSHEEKDEEGMHYQARHFTRKFLLPDNVEKDKMRACITKDGRIECLRVEAPLKRPEGKEMAKEIPVTINHK